ncbi:hypothetical protein JXD38_07445 [candidate division WOR-3 bacterium]|nr:hypothetical protein [candidate division WOR-3 bacterium]
MRAERSFVRFSVLLIVCLVGLATADSLDYTRVSVVVVTTDSGARSLQSTDVLKQRMLRTLGSASYDRDWTVGQYLASHSLVQRRLDRMNLASDRLGTKFLSDGTVSTAYEFLLTGSVLGLMLPVRSTPHLLGPTACPCCGQPWPEGKEPPPGVELVPYETPGTPEYTGILVDAKGLNARPALFPQIVTETGDDVFSSDFADPEQVTAHGLVGYFYDRTQALTGNRVGTNPLVVRALGVTGTNFCDLIVNQSDAARIHGSRSNLDLLSRCRVGFLID